jgi:hypothetical protein
MFIIYNMILWLINTILVSLVVIFIIHYLYYFFKENLTQPKIKDLLHHPKQEYEDIFKIINNPQVSHEPNVNKSHDTETTSIGSLPNSFENDTKKQAGNFKASDMKNELSMFLLEGSNDLITQENEGEYNNFSFNVN